MVKENPLVSVVIPTYNRPKYLQRAVDSVREQTYENIEIVIIDDCPSNPVESIAKQFSDSRIRYVRHEENKGVCAARNTGITEAIGDYLCFLDDDDEWRERKVESQMEVLAENPSVGLVYTGTQYVGDSLELLSVTKPTQQGNVSRELLLEDFVPFSTILVKREVIEIAGMLDTNLTNWEDWEWCVRLSKQTELGYVEQPLVLIHKGSHDKRSGNFEKKRDVGFEKFLSKVQPVAAEYGPLFERKFLAHAHYHLGYAGLSNGYHSDARTELWTAVRLWPFVTRFYVYLLLALVGKRGYESAQSLKRWWIN